MALRERVEMALAEVGMKKGELASRCGHTPTWVTHLLAGKVRWTAETEARLCKALRVRPSFFAGEFPRRKSE